MATATTEEIEYDFSQLDDTLISDHQKQSLIDYINQLKSQKRSATDDFNAFKLSTGSSRTGQRSLFRFLTFILPTYYFLFLTKRTNERIFSLDFCDLYFSLPCAFNHRRVQLNAIASSWVSDFCSHARSRSISSCARRPRSNSIFAHFRSGETSPHETTAPVELHLVAHGQSRLGRRQFPDHVRNVDLHRSGDQPRTGEVDHDDQPTESTRASE